MKRNSLPSIGAAVDLGTTEIRVGLVDTADGSRIAKAAAANPQSVFGTDVLSRLTAAAESLERADELRRLAGNAIASLLRNLCRQHDLAPAAVRSVAIVGNTAMLTLLSGSGYRELLQPVTWRNISSCPFDDPAATARSWGLDPACRIGIVPPLAGFVGSDLVAGVLATRLAEGPPGALLIDFGTNTEIALWDGSRLWATSAAGGPAFEGCGISCGMTAVDGAVQRVEWSDERSFTLSVIGGDAPKGICGSGLVDATACLLRFGMLTKGGRFKGAAAGRASLPLDAAGRISVAGRDIDALQRAKAGVAAAVRCLLVRAGMEPGAIGRVRVSGAFGNYLNVKNSQAIGLLPPIEEGSIELCGNTALAGCEMILAGEALPTIPAQWQPTVVNMSHVRAYEDLFVESLYLEPWKVETVGSPQDGGSHA